MLTPKRNINWRAVRTAARDILFLGGIGLVGVGIWMYTVPGSIIYAGIALAVLAYLTNESA